MNKLVLILSLFFSCVAFSKGDIEAGKQKALTCTACHGADGNSNLTNYPKLASQYDTYLYKQLQDLKLGMTSGGQQGRYDPVMSAMAMMLSEQDMVDLAAYYAAQKLSQASTNNSFSEQTRALYLVGNREKGITACAACHGPKGEGMKSAGFPKLAGQHADYIQLQLEKFRHGNRSNDANDMMSDIAKKLTDDDIKNLSQYVSSQH